MLLSTYRCSSIIDVFCVLCAHVVRSPPIAQHQHETMNDNNNTPSTTTTYCSNKKSSADEKEAQRKSEQQQNRPLTKCQLWMPKKQRFCNQKRRDDSIYCGNHYHLDDDTDETTITRKKSVTSSSPIIVTKRQKRTQGATRIPCPIDPSHTIWSNAVEKHILVCPKARELKQYKSLPYYRPNINCGRSTCIAIEDGVKQSKNHPSIHIASLEKACSLALAIIRVYTSIFNPASSSSSSSSSSRSTSQCDAQKLSYDDIYNAISVQDLSQAEEKAGISTELRQGRVRTGGPKHVQQQGSIVGHLRRVGMLPRLIDDNDNYDDNEQDVMTTCSSVSVSSKKFSRKDNKDCTVLEMGAGRGMLGLVVAGVVNASNYAQHRHHYTSPQAPAADGSLNNNALQLQLQPDSHDVSSASTSTSTIGTAMMPTTSLIVIERGGSGGKADTKIRTSNIAKDDEHNNTASQKSGVSYLRLKDLRIERLKCDLADIHLPTALPFLAHRDRDDDNDINNAEANTNPTQCIVVGKHVCGVATDLSLRSLSKLERGSISGCAFATCCHGICNWRDYVGQAYLTAKFEELCSMEFGEKEFRLLTRWTTGSILKEDTDLLKFTVGSDTDDHFNTCTASGGVNAEKHEDEGHVTPHDNDTSDPCNIRKVVKELKLLCGVRGLGRACQRLIDYGRKEYMRDVLCITGHLDLKYYVDESVTPQNALLIGCGINNSNPR